METSSVLLLPKVHAPGLDQAFLSSRVWLALPFVRLRRAEDGDIAALATDLRVAWSTRGLHVCFSCAAPMPGQKGDCTAPVKESDAVGVFLDPHGERGEYMAILADVYGRVADARIENPLHHSLESEVDRSWHCFGLRIRSWAQHVQWVIELLIPFTGITPAITPPHPGDRWTGNFYRIERRVLGETSAWRPCYGSPPDLHNSEQFGILEFGTGEG